MTGQRRLADDGVPDPRRPSRSSAAPTSPSSAPRQARLPRPAAGAIDDAWRNRRDDAASSRPTSSPRRIGRTARRCRAGRRPPRRRRPRRAPRPRCSAGYDDRVGRLRPAPEVPADDEPRAAAARRTRRTGDADALRPRSRTSLDAMAAGGIYDHLGGGFARYSVDDALARPPLREDALRPGAAGPGLPPRLAGHRRRRATARCVDETIGYVLRDLRHPAGGFSSAEDADSEGVEGRFYVWTPDEVARGARRRRRPPRSSGTASPRPATSRARTILNRPHAGRPRCARPTSRRPARRLFDGPRASGSARARRQGPHRVERADARRRWPRRRGHRQRGDWLDGRRARPPSSCCAELRRADGRWLRSWQADARRPPPRLRRRPRRPGRRLHPPGRGHRRGPLDRRGPAPPPTPCSTCSGTTTTAASSPPAHDAEALVARPKDLLDNATPVGQRARRRRACSGSPRSPARTRYRDARRRHPAACWARVAGEHPTAFAHLLAARRPATRRRHRDRRRRRPARPGRPPSSSRYLPNAVLAWGEPYDSPLWEGREPRASAYVCRDYACQLPADSAEVLAGQLAG